MVRLSRSTNSARAIAAAASRNQTAAPSLLTPTTSRVRPTVPVTAPGRSSRPLWPGLSGRPARVAASTARPSRTENHSTERQPQNWVSTPPSITPPLKLAAPTAA